MNQFESNVKFNISSPIFPSVYQQILKFINVNLDSLLNDNESALDSTIVKNLFCISGFLLLISRHILNIMI